MRYYELMRDMSSKFNYRYEMVQFGEEYGISEAARVYETTRRTVRKWRDRYRKERMDGLGDRKRSPKRIPHKMSRKKEEEIVRLRERHKRRWGAYRLKLYYGLKVSENAIERVIKQRGLVKKRRKKWKRREDLREKKKR